MLARCTCLRPFPNSLAVILPDAALVACPTNLQKQVLDTECSKRNRTDRACRLDCTKSLQTVQASFSPCRGCAGEATRTWGMAWAVELAHELRDLKISPEKP